MSIREELEDLKRRMAILEKKPIGKRQKMEEVADWIMKQFEKKDVYTTRRLFEMALKEKGWKYQTLQIARRHMLEDKIGVEHRKGKGWCWVGLNDN